MLERFSVDFDWERLRRVVDRDGATLDIFNSLAQISLEDIILFQDTEIWNVQMLRANALAITQKKLRLTYMCQKIQRCCSQRVLNELQKKKDLYAKPNGEVDGVIFLKLLVTKYSSKTIYTSRNIIKSFRYLKLSNFEHNVQKLYDHLQDDWLRLQGLDFNHHLLILDIFDILKTSTNEEFIIEIKQIEKQLERGEDMEWTDVMDQAVDIYHDLFDKNVWNKLDP